MAYFMARGLTLLAEGPETHEGALTELNLSVYQWTS